MSERLTPEQQRQARIRMTGEVQGLADAVSGYTQLPRDPDALPLADQLRLHKHAQSVVDFMAQATGLPIHLTREDRLRGAIVEACTWLQQGAPGCALQALEDALKL